MAYVNMTIDGQTRKTTQLTLKDSNGNTKTATLEAVLESSDGIESGVTDSFGNKPYARGYFYPQGGRDVNGYAYDFKSLPSDCVALISGYAEEHPSSSHIVSVFGSTGQITSYYANNGSMSDVRSSNASWSSVSSTYKGQSITQCSWHSIQAVGSANKGNIKLYIEVYKTTEYTGETYDLGDLSTPRRVGDTDDYVFFGSTIPTE